jgi:hypothetical protein
MLENFRDAAELGMGFLVAVGLFLFARWFLVEWLPRQRSGDEKILGWLQEQQEIRHARDCDILERVEKMMAVSQDNLKEMQKSFQASQDTLREYYHNDLQITRREYSELAASTTAAVRSLTFELRAFMQMLYDGRYNKPKPIESNDD